MAIRLGNKLGIEFHLSELRVIETKTHGNGVAFTNVGAIPMDPGYIQAGVVINPQLVAERLRVYLDRQRISATDALASFATDNCACRVLNLPKAPESEMKALIAGEVDHFGLVRQGGVYDYIRLLATSTKETAGASVLLMATDGNVINSIDKTLDMAGLRLVALEPTHIALFRSAYLLSARTEQTLFLTISESKSDVALVHDGKMAYYRSFEVGTQEMVNTTPSDSMFEVGDDIHTISARYLHLEAVSTLAIEIRRTIEYFNREMPDLPNISRIAIASNGPAIQPIADWLQEAVGLECEFVRMPGNVLTNSEDFSLEDSVRFLTCYGLGMRDSSVLPKDHPKMDLSLHEQMVSRLEISDRRARLASYVSAGVFVAAVAACSIGTMKLNRAKVELEIAKKDLKITQDLERRRLADLQIRTDRLAYLKDKGIPVNPIIIGIGRSMPAQAGLSDLKLTTGKVDLSGEASAEDALVRLTRDLQKNNFVTNVSLYSFERLFNNEGSRGIRFRMTVSTLNNVAPANGSTNQGGIN